MSTPGVYKVSVMSAKLEKVGLFVFFIISVFTINFLYESISRKYAISPLPPDERNKYQIYFNSNLTADREQKKELYGTKKLPPSTLPPKENYKSEQTEVSLHEFISIHSQLSFHSENTRKTTRNINKNKEEIASVTNELFQTVLNEANVHLVKTSSNASFLARVKEFSSSITQHRKEIFRKRGRNKQWQDVSSPNDLKVIWGNGDDFLERLSLENNVYIVALPWDNTSLDANALRNEYYQWTASDILCNWIRTPGLTKAHWDAVYNRTCNGSLEQSRQSRKLEYMYYYGKPINKLHYWPNDGLSYPSRFYTRPPSVILYLTVVQDGVVNLVGDVISGKIKIVPYTCSHDSIPTIPIEYPEAPIYKEVFVITQYWGSSFFHRMVEVVPRLAPYIDFLKQNPRIYVHAPEDRGMLSQMMKMMGLNPERIVTGIIRAKVIYLPQGTPCGFPQVQGIQLMSYHFIEFLKNQATNNTFNTTDLPVRNKLVLIRRSGQRRFLHDREIGLALKDFARKNRLDFVVFSDRPPPGLIETALIFHSALIVVGPHGAGLANTVFCQPGTLVVEGVCNPPHVNMCFQFVTHVLGLRYHGVPSLSGCEDYVNVDPLSLLHVLEEYKSIVL